MIFTKRLWSVISKSAKAGVKQWVNNNECPRKREFVGELFLYFCSKSFELLYVLSVAVLNHKEPLVACVNVVRPLDRDPLKAGGSFKILTCSLTEEAANTSKTNTQAVKSSGNISGKRLLLSLHITLLFQNKKEEFVS